MGLPKEYIASIEFGTETDSMDLDGRIIRFRKIADLDMGRLNSILMDFTGRIKQLPPMYSALKHKGKPLYKFARMGIDIKREPREIEITGIEVLETEKNILKLKIKCSSGTYIRSLANDIGKAYGTGAVLAGLIRTGIGDFSISAAKAVDEVLNMAGNDRKAGSSGWMISLQELFSENTSVYISKGSEKKILNGSPLRADMMDTDKKGLQVLLRELKNYKGRFDKVIAVRTIGGDMIALHEQITGSYVENIKSFDEDFTKSVVIF